MQDDHTRIRFSGRGARLQHALLTGLFRLAVTRGLYGRFARGLGRFFDRGNAALVDIGGARPFRVQLDDGYWTRFALRGAAYEPEIGRVMAAAAGHTARFLDLGANQGYWTLRGAALFDHVLAVEAAAESFGHLQANAGRLPGVCLRRAAVHRTGGERLTLATPPLSHASARLASGAGAAGDRVESVESVSIDELLSPGLDALVKLDVEGAEVAAFEGATRALVDGAVVIYEDHGSDRDCLPSAWLLERTDFGIWTVTGTPREITALDELRRLKTDPRRGYNFLAARKDAPLARAILTSLQSGAGGATTLARPQ